MPATGSVGRSDDRLAGNFGEQDHAHPRLPCRALGNVCDHAHACSGIQMTLHRDQRPCTALLRIMAAVAPSGTAHSADPELFDNAGVDFSSGTARQEGGHRKPARHDERCHDVLAMPQGYDECAVLGLAVFQPVRTIDQRIGCSDQPHVTIRQPDKRAAIPALTLEA